NPPGDFAGRLIDAAGLKGHRLGGAMVSEKHANFIVNTGDATATDVRELMRLCQRTVKTRFGVDLVPEVEVVGEWT
ncbi:MAG: UDP-N-acetylenolpyruvoylglucosamine reductase, partial [Chloroflexi bacterium]|nr:UDP-N-acetylenolpyruvoylglucosamine reductase [Chloroflexota bacterium]